MSDSGKVLIIGAGPVGLYLALGLLRRGIDVQVFERDEKLPVRPGVGTIFPSTMEMFRRSGIDREVLEIGEVVGDLQFWNCQTRELVAKLPFTIIDQHTEFPFHLHCMHGDIVKVLADRVSLLSPAAICTGHELVSVEEREGGVVARIRNFEGERDYEGDYIVGADGKDSFLRGLAGIHVESLVEDHRFLMVESDLDFSAFYPGIGNTGVLYNDQECVSLLGFRGRMQTTFPLHGKEAGGKPDAEMARGLIHQLVGEDVDFAITEVAEKPIKPSVARQFRSGRILLAGDSAHSHGTPADGVCLNSGFHDADLLARAFRQQLIEAPDGDALDEYAKSRRRVALDHLQKSSSAFYHHHANRAARRPALEKARLTDMASSQDTARTYLLRASFMNAQVANQAADYHQSNIR